MNLTKRLNHLIKALLFPIGLMCLQPTTAQKLDIYNCYEMAIELSPLKQKENYFNTIDELNQLIQTARNYPSLTLEATASYQSDVFSLPTTLPGVDFPNIPKDQYSVAFKLNQRIYDGGTVSATKAVETMDKQVRQSELEISLYQIRGIINELYFGSLKLQQQEELLINLLGEFDNKIKTAESGVKNGVLLNSELNRLLKEKLKTQQQLILVRSSRSTFLILLGNWTGRQISEDQLTLPESISNQIELPLNRPELMLFESQNEKLEAMAKLTSIANSPKLFGFVNAGFAQPNPFNFYETDWNTYYMVGAKLSWGLDWGQSKNQRKILMVNQQIVGAEQDNFIRVINNDITKKQAEIDQMKAIMELDKQILRMQEAITKEADKQFELGVISSSDLLTDLNDKAQAELNLKLHQIEIEKMKVELLTISGNLP